MEKNNNKQPSSRRPLPTLPNNANTLNNVPTPQQPQQSGRALPHIPSQSGTVPSINNLNPAPQVTSQSLPQSRPLSASQPITPSSIKGGSRRGMQPGNRGRGGQQENPIKVEKTPTPRALPPAPVLPPVANNNNANVVDKKANRLSVKNLSSVFESGNLSFINIPQNERVDSKRISIANNNANSSMENVGWLKNAKPMDSEQQLKDLKLKIVYYKRMKDSGVLLDKNARAAIFDELDYSREIHQKIINNDQTSELLDFYLESIIHNLDVFIERTAKKLEYSSLNAFGYNPNRLYREVSGFVNFHENYFLKENDKNILKPFLILKYFLIQPLCQIVHFLNNRDKNQPMTAQERGLFRQYIIAFLHIMDQYAAKMQPSSKLSQEKLSKVFTLIYTHCSEEERRIGAVLSHWLGDEFYRKEADAEWFIQMLPSIGIELAKNQTLPNALGIAGLLIQKFAELEQKSLAQSVDDPADVIEQGRNYTKCLSLFLTLAISTKVEVELKKTQAPAPAPINNYSSIHVSLELNNKSTSSKKQMHLSVPGVQSQSSEKRNLHASLEISKKTVNSGIEKKVGPNVNSNQAPKPSQESNVFANQKGKLLSTSGSNNNASKRTVAPIGGIAVMPPPSAGDLDKNKLFNKRQSQIEITPQPTKKQ